MSFFDEVDETRVEPPADQSRRRPPRSGRRPPGGGRRPPGGRTPPGGGRRSPTEEQAIRVRRAVAAVALVIVLILIVVGVHSCQVSQRNSALRNYSDNVATIVRTSNQTGQQFFTLLSSAQGSSNAPNLQSRVDEAHLTAENQLGRAQGLSVPDEDKGAQQNLVLALQMRRDGIGNVAHQLQSALQPSTASAAVNAIAAEMARLYASDVLYKDYTLPVIVGALHGAGIAVGGINGVPLESGQFVPAVQWLTPSYVVQQLHVSLPTPTGTTKAAPGVHGHALDSCSIAGTALSTSSANTISAGSTPTLSCMVTNDGQNTENNVVVKATIPGTSVSGQGTIPQTQPGQQYTVQIPLSSSPPNGTYSLTVAIQHVPGETTFTHNSKTFPVTFG